MVVDEPGDLNVTRLRGEDAALGIRPLDQHLALAARQVNQDDGHFLATSDAALWAKALVASSGFTDLPPAGVSSLELEWTDLQMSTVLMTRKRLKAGYAGSCGAPLVAAIAHAPKIS